MDLPTLIDDVERHAPDDPLDRLVAATLRQAELADLADQLLDHFVQAARSAGCSWAQIGEAIGVSKQAAQQRHGPEAAGPRPGEGEDDDPLSGLLGWIKRRGLGRRRFERFTQRARDAVVEAQAVAHTLHHQEIGTEHVLIGLLTDPESVAAKLLAAWSVTRDEVVAAAEAHRERSESPPRGHIPFTRESKKALELALREALALGHNYIGTEHILLGIVHADDRATADILRKHDVTLSKAREAVVEALQGHTPGGSAQGSRQ